MRERRRLRCCVQTGQQVGGCYKRFPPRLSNQPCLVSGTPHGVPFFCETKRVMDIARRDENAAIHGRKVTKRLGREPRSSARVNGTRSVSPCLPSALNRLGDAVDIPAVACCRSFIPRDSE